MNNKITNNRMSKMYKTLEGVNPNWKNIFKRSICTHIQVHLNNWNSLIQLKQIH